MRKHHNSGPTAREMRRAAWRGEIARLRRFGVSRRLANYMLQNEGGSWRTFGMPGEMGGPEYGPPAPKRPWAKDGIPVGQRCIDGKWVTL